MTDDEAVTVRLTYREAQMVWRALDVYKHAMNALHVETPCQGAGRFDMNAMTSALVDVQLKVEEAQRAQREHDSFGLR